MDIIEQLHRENRMCYRYIVLFSTIAVIDLIYLYTILVK